MGFIKYEPFDRKQICRDREHNPPTHIVLQPGIYTWQCPACGRTIRFIVPQGPMLEVKHEVKRDDWTTMDVDLKPGRWAQRS